MMGKYLVSIIIHAGLLLPFVSYSQTNSVLEDSPSFMDRVYVGGNFSMQFGTVTAIDISPLVGYRITDKFSTGLGITYQYLSTEVNVVGGSLKYETNIYGGRLFARYNIGQQFYAHSEYESLNLEYYDPLNDDIRREWIPGFFVGGGLFQPIGNRAGFNITALYNLIHDEIRSPYNSPFVFRIGITGGF